VYGFRNAIYSITASTEQVIALQDGIPIQSQVKHGQWRYYKFMVSDEALTLTVGINLISGQSDMYIMLNKEPSTDSFLYRTLSWNQDKTVHFQHLTCPNDDDDDDEMCAYYIGVYGATESTYSVFVQSTDSDAPYLLQDGVPISRQIGVGQFLYLKYESVNALDYITVSLTPISGAPECYISDSDAVQHPFRSDYTYKMVDGANSLQITHFAANDTVFYFTVFAQVSSAFALSVVGEHYNRSADATGVQLVEGKIQFGSTSNWAYYSFTPSNSMQTDIIIAVYSVSGDPDIYCNVDEFPTLTRYLYAANLDGPETLTIPHRNETYFCGVHADNEANAEFYILAYHAHSIVTLLDDIPVIGQLDDVNNVNFYHFIAPDADSDEHGIISIILTPIYSQPCFMYVSHQTYRPNATVYEYKMNNSINHGLNALNLKISKQDLSVATDWYISVQPVESLSAGASSDQSALYTLILTYDNVSTLSPGLPQTGILTAAHEAYYIWHVDLSDKESDKPLVIDVSLLTGNCTIFLSRNPSLLNSCNNGIGCPTGLVEAHQICTENEPFVILPHDAYYITQGTYYLAVCSSAQNNQVADETYYNIFASTAYALIYLSNGVPLWDYIELDEYRYYSLLCDAENMVGLDVSVTPNSEDGATCSFKLHGLISVHRSRPIEPAQDGEYSTMWIDTNGAVFSMSTEDASFTTHSQYFISVHAVSDDPIIAEGVDPLSMTYSIVAVASYADSVEYRVLINDAEQMAMIENTDAKRYYSFQSEEAAQTLKFTIFCAQGQVSMYVISDERMNHKSEHDGPSSDHFEFKLENIQPQSGTRTIVAREPCKHCAYLVVVYAAKQSVFVIRANAYSVDAGEPNNSTDRRLSKAEKVATYVGTAIVCVIIVALCTFYAISYRKNKRLTFELDVAELQLNMGGNKSLRQRKEELQSVNNGPAQPIYSDHDELGDMQQIKRKNKNKYVELQDDNVENNEAFDNPMLLDSQNRPNI